LLGAPARSRATSGYPEKSLGWSRCGRAEVNILPKHVLDGVKIAILRGLISVQHRARKLGKRMATMKLNAMGIAVAAAVSAANAPAAPIM